MSGDRAQSDGAPPLFTIAIPTFNRAHLLRDCLASALAQRFPDFEVVVSDNASSDATGRLLEDVADPRLRFVRQGRNIGLIPNWNACLSMARGRYTVVLSDDDRVEPDFLERCARLVRQSPGLPAIIGLSNLHSLASARTRPARRSAALATGICRGPDLLLEYLSDSISVTMCSVALRTDLLRERGGFSSELPHMADVAAWAPFLFADAVGFINAPCATFAYHAGSETSRLAVERRLRDGAKLVDLLSTVADERVSDDRLRRDIKDHARRCFARRGLQALADPTLAEARAARLRAGWNLRRDLGARDLVYASGFVAKVMCPGFLADFLRRHRPGAQAAA